MAVETRPAGRKRSRAWWWIAGVGLVLVAAVAGALVVFRPQAAQSSTRSFSAPVTQTSEQVLLNLTGTLVPQHEADLSFGTSGKVTAVSATVGQPVKAGQVLATLDSTQLKNAVTLAQANLDAANASLDSVESADTPTDAQLSSAKAQVTSAQAKLDSANASLSQAQLTSTLDGTVASVNLTVGGQVSGSNSGSGSAATGGSGSGASSNASSSNAGSSSAQVVVISPNAWQVNGTVGPADVAGLKVGQPVTATVSGTTNSATGTIATIGVVATTSGGTTSFPVTATLNGSPAGFYDGVTVSMSVTTGTYPNVLTVPTLALTTGSAGATVDKLVNGQGVTTPVETGKVFGDRTQILSGLAAGDQVQITTRFQPGAQRSASAGIQFPGFGGAGGAGGGAGGAGGNRQNGGGFGGGAQRGSGTGG